MLKFVLFRLFQGLIVLAAIYAVTFFLVAATPGLLLAWLICGWADHPGFESRNLLLFWILAGISTYLKSRVAVYPSLSAPS